VVRTGSRAGTEGARRARHRAGRVYRLTYANPGPFGCWGSAGNPMLIQTYATFGKGGVP
jgi:hypothetical protein